VGKEGCGCDVDAMSVMGVAALGALRSWKLRLVPVVVEWWV
jgi:hypothetical protein